MQPEAAAAEQCERGLESTECNEGDKRHADERGYSRHPPRRALRTSLPMHMYRCSVFQCLCPGHWSLRWGFLTWPVGFWQPEQRHDGIDTGEEPCEKKRQPVIRQRGECADG